MVGQISPMKFQFLIGTLKTVAEGDLWEVGWAFQFLIGTLKTWSGRDSTHCGRRVSIPDRYSKNGNYQLGRGYVMAFQFLIGTLKTFANPAALMACSLFQFLIGTLKTDDCWIIWCGLNAFQFLIGTLKTPAGVIFDWRYISFNSW